MASEYFLGGEDNNFGSKHPQVKLAYTVVV